MTFDEDASLLESALGGPDTTTRSQTVWQVRLAPVDADLRCSDLDERAPRSPRPRRMAAELAAPDPSADPCEISASGGYQRLENQLYRVQVHDDVPNPASGADGTFLWSRDNGCVVAGIDALELVDADEAVLTLDRLGRDDELSFEAGQLVELTSRDRELRGLPGFLAVTGPRTGFDLPVTWRGTAARLARRPRDGADRAPLGGRAGADHYRPDRPGGRACRSASRPAGDRGPATTGRSRRGPSGSPTGSPRSAARSSGRRRPGATSSSHPRGVRAPRHPAGDPRPVRRPLVDRRPTAGGCSRP